MIYISGIKRIAFVILLALFLSSCSRVPLPAETPAPREAPLPVETPTLDVCSSEHLRQTIAMIDDAAQQFEDVTQLAENTPGENLVPVFEDLLSIRQDVEDIATPLCAIKTKAALDSYMDSKIQCYLKIYADFVLETPRADRGEKDLCSLAPSKLEYYNGKMDELKVLLLE